VLKRSIIDLGVDADANILDAIKATVGVDAKVL